ncbi:MAG: arginase family protein, partial [Mariniphaga sp.]
EIIEKLPEQVYISFDIDGLDPKLCPHTGTPVPGGLDFPEAVYLLKRLTESGRRIIGFDVCETGNNEWDANVAARIIYKICNLTGRSQGLI